MVERLAAGRVDMGWGCSGVGWSCEEGSTGLLFPGCGGAGGGVG